MKQKLYKVLINGKSCQGGNTEWKLKQWTPQIDNCKICNSGYHLTTKPEQWYKYGCDFYEAEAKDIIEWDNDKCVCKTARIIKKIKKPEWIIKTEDFIKNIHKVKFGKQDGKILKEWKYFEEKSLMTARDAARNASIYSRFLIISDLIEKDENLKKHWLFIQKCWEVYKKGYWLRCDINGVLYVYGVKK